VIGGSWSSDESRRHARVVAGTVLALFFPGFLYLIHFVVIGVLWMALAVGSTIAINVVNLWWLRRSHDGTTSGLVGVSVFLVLLSLSALSTGGFYGPNFSWLYVVPVFAALLVNIRAGAIFTGLVLAIAVGFWSLSELGIGIENSIPESERAIRSLIDRVGAVSTLGVFIAVLASRERAGKEQLEDANKSLTEEMHQREQFHDRMIHTERLASMGKLSAAVAHEINNPMTYVIGNLQTLQSDDEISEGDREELIEDAIVGALRVSALVKDMQVYARTPHTSELVAVDISGVFEAVLKMVANKVRYISEIIVHCEPGLRALATEAQLVQVIMNLLTNAMDAMGGPVESNTLRLSAKETVEGVVIDVADTGSGISPEVQKKLYEPFYTTKDVGQGTGMGLSISRSLIEGMNGSIRFASVADQGTTFTVVLPKVPAAQGLEVETTRSETVSPIARQTNLNVLVIDDDAAVLRVVKRMLGHCTVSTIDDPQKALAMCDACDFDLILCDVMMPTMSGDQFYRSLKASHPTLAERVTFITGGALTSETEKFLESVDRPVLLKPLDLVQLRQFARDQINKNSPRSSD